MERRWSPLSSAAVVLLSVSLTSAAFLDVVPGGSVTEGQRVEVRCSEIFAYGVNRASRLILEQNSTNSRQAATWYLKGRRLVYSENWILTKNVSSWNRMETIYGLTFVFYASAFHNKMRVRCLSSRVSTYRSPAMTINVKSAPSVMNCVQNPPQIVPNKAIQVKCWVMLGMPLSRNVKLTGKRVRVLKTKYLYSTNSRFSYRIVRYQWIVTPRRYDSQISLKVKSRNSIGEGSMTLTLVPKTKKQKKKVVKDTGARILLEPKRGSDFHVGDKVRCRVTNTTFNWRVTLKGKTTGDTNLKVLTTSETTNEVVYIIPESSLRKFMSFNCTASSKLAADLVSDSLTEWIYPSSHRTFFTMKDSGSVLEENQTARAICHFLPRPGPEKRMNISIVNKNEVKFASTFDGKSVTEEKNALGKRVSTDCKVDANLFACTIDISRLQAEDTNSELWCKTETNVRVDALKQKIEVQQWPVVALLSPSAIEGYANDTVTATCLIRLGKPAATDLNFEFENSEVNASRKDDAAMDDSSGFKWKVLRITKRLTSSDHGTKLLCSAKNIIKESVREVPITIIQPIYNLTISPSPNTTLTQGQKFTCVAYGYPLPELTISTTHRGKKFTQNGIRNAYHTKAQIAVSNFYPDESIEISCSGSNIVRGKVYELEDMTKYSPKKWLPV